MYALVTYDGYALDVVDGALDAAVAQARNLGAHEVVFDQSYDLSELFKEEVERLGRAANPTKKLRALEVPGKPGKLRRLAVLPTPDELSVGAARAVAAYEKTGEFPKGLKQKEALEILRHLGPAGRLQAAGVFQELDPEKAPEAAWGAANKIQISMDEVLAMDPGDAFNRIARFREDRLEAGDKLPMRWTSIRRFMAPILERETGMASIIGLLGTNYKMAKAGREFGPVDVMGLSILPQRLWALGFDGPDPRKGTFNACIGASPECAQACLVYSGHNTEGANEVKAARMDGLVNEPVAFARILVASIQRHKADAGHGRPRFDGFTPFVRLNVFSDLPWELMFPDLFHFFDDLSFYDYSKIPGRHRTLAAAGIDNYDLTFSWSGMNARAAQWEWEHHGKVTMIFFKTTQEAGFWRTHEHWRGRMERRSGVPAGPMPTRFLGMEVINGDQTDVRPLDATMAKGPRPWVIGLRYKPPQGQAFDKFRSLFVVPVEEIDGAIVAAVVPRDQPGVMQSSLREAATLIKLERLEERAQEKRGIPKDGELWDRLVAQAQKAETLQWPSPEAEEWVVREYVAAGGKFGRRPKIPQLKPGEPKRPFNPATARRRLTR